MKHKTFACLISAAVSLCSSYTAFDGKVVPVLPLAASNVVTVTTPVALYQALRNQSAGQTIVIGNGTYDVSPWEPIQIDVANLTLRGQSEDPHDVVFVGKGFENCGAVGEEMIQINTDRFTIANLTLSETRTQALKLQTMGNDSCLVHNVRFFNNGEWGIKAPNGPVSYGWEIRYCHFENNKVPVIDRCQDMDGGNYIGGMTLMKCEGWNIHDNVFRNIQGATNRAMGAILNWNGCANNVIQRNLIMGCDQGIDFWATTTNMVVKNNMIVPGAMNSMYIADGTGTQVCNNTIFSVFTTNNGSIIFENTTGVIFKDNIVYGSLVQTGTVTIDTESNIFLTRTNRLAAAAWFGDEAMGDLHLKSDTCAPINAGVEIAWVTDDWDGTARTGQRDIGADEYAAGTGIVREETRVAVGLVVDQVFPNPFNPATRIRYSISEPMRGNVFFIKVHSASGMVIKTLASGSAVAGIHEVVWDGTDSLGRPAASGTYWIVVQCGGAQKSVRAVLWK